MARTAGSEPGTRVVVLDGGPPEWAGTVAGISRTCVRAERWDHIADSPVVWHASTEYREVEIEHHYTSGPTTKRHQAQVFTYIGYREDEDALRERRMLEEAAGAGGQAQGSILL